MTGNYKPEGYNSVSPYFIVDGAAKLIELLIGIFDGKEMRKYEKEDGTIMHAEIKIEDSILMFGNASEEYPPNELLTHIYVPDVDKVFGKAIELGCEAVEKPKEREGDTDRRGIFKDFAGNVWAIGTQVGPEN